MKRCIDRNCSTKWIINTEHGNPSSFSKFVRTIRQTKFFAHFDRLWNHEKSINVWQIEKMVLSVLRTRRNNSQNIPLVSMQPLISLVILVLVVFLCGDDLSHFFGED